MKPFAVRDEGETEALDVERAVERHAGLGSQGPRRLGAKQQCATPAQLRDQGVITASEFADAKVKAVP